MHAGLIMTCRCSPDLFGVREADGVGEGGVPELDDGGAELLVLVRKRHTEQRREQSQELIVVRQRRARLKTAEDLAEKLLQL